MANKSTFYIQLDEDFLQDPEVQLFLVEKGEAAVFRYLMLLTRMRAYEDFDFMIPFSYIPVIARKDLMISSDELKDTIEYCIKIGFFKVEDDGIEKFFYSERLQRSLRTWKVNKQVWKDAGSRGGKKTQELRHKGETTTNDEVL